MPKTARAKELLFTVASRLVLVALLVIVWDLVVRSGRVSPLLLPPPLAVVRKLGELLQGAELWDNVGLTAYNVVAAFGVSVVTGIGLGALAGASRYWSNVMEPMIVAAYTVPIIVIYPVITLLFGIGDLSKILFAGLYGFFPIAANTIRGLRNVPATMTDVGRALGASPRQLRWSILMPAARPLILAGIRIGLSLNLVGVIAAQMLASTNGIGYLISTNAQLLNAEALYAYILVTFFLAALVNFILTRNEQAKPGTGAFGSRFARARRPMRPATT